MPAETAVALSRKAASILERSSVAEFKWNKLRSVRERAAAEELCELAVTACCGQNARVDVLIWDIEDPRHKVPGRDDTANLGRMYYHLLKNVLRRRWPDWASWELHPDEHADLSWKMLFECLQAKSTKSHTQCQLPSPPGTWVEECRLHYGIVSIEPVNSKEHPLLQIADLFAGLAIFSFEKYNEYATWLNQGQLSLLGEAAGDAQPSNSTRERLLVLRTFEQMCKQKRLGVSLKRSKGLQTPDPKNPINFWLYRPQTAKDKAPRK
jgi:hypothetical protein